MKDISRNLTIWVESSWVAKINLLKQLIFFWPDEILTCSGLQFQNYQKSTRSRTGNFFSRIESKNKIIKLHSLSPPPAVAVRFRIYKLIYFQLKFNNTRRLPSVFIENFALHFRIDIVLVVVATIKILAAHSTHKKNSIFKHYTYNYTYI